MNSTTNLAATSSSTEILPENVLQSIQQSLIGLRFGQVTLIVQDGRVIQIDRTERHRFTAEKETRH
jgi:hypothetical protein